MKAVTVYGAGDLRVTEIEDPQAGPGQVRIKMEYGGICGSDLAYWKHGASGTAILREPLVLGHEVAGRIDQLGDGVAGLELGQAVTVNPATPVGEYHVPAHLRGETICGLRSVISVRLLFYRTSRAVFPPIVWCVRK
ncbi:alcohol dehydrogenase catalytic domain-containing protein [Actinobaculum sp. 313]|uniref:alcohol dehydrogenase catalytic domain-containing protein n=1 Tax=Actinobaculum sp. 313 TaxID=2495645 RepID=UPI00196A6EF2|nr:alcohol dehydrogenase catalytic domain-containing protein [Actinobaculum sp. 313]